MGVQCRQVQVNSDVEQHNITAKQVWGKRTTNRVTRVWCTTNARRQDQCGAETNHVKSNYGLQWKVGGNEYRMSAPERRREATGRQNRY